MPDNADIIKSSLPLSTYTPSSSWKQIFHNIWEYKFFIKQLIRISILGDLKRSIIGLLWLFILPIVSVFVWIILNGAGVIQPGDTDDIPYPAYVLLSTFIWGFFAEMYKTSSYVVLNNGRIMVMAFFPHEVLIVERIIVHLIQFAIPFTINIIVLYFFGIQFTWTSLLFPLSLIPLLLLGLSFGLIVALMRTIAVDFSKMADEGIKFLMFLTPVVYSPKISLGWLSDIIHLNPLTYLVGFSRELLTKGTFYEPQAYLICCIGSILFFLITLKFFLKAESKVLEKLIIN